MFNKNNLILVLLCALFLVSISSVCAADNTTVTVPDNHDTVIVHNATYSDLVKDIANLNPGDTYTFNQNYVFDPWNDPGYVGPKLGGHDGILISKDNITINGNGHSIDGNFKTAIFKVTGNNVKIKDLTIKNGEYHGWNVPITETIWGKVGDTVKFNKLGYHLEDISPVTWSGDNGVVDNCIFSKNHATNGGAIDWKGDNGVITNTWFLDNFARGVAGAAYIEGKNMTITSTYFVNSTSALSGEAVYLDRKHGNYNFKNNHLIEQEHFGVDGSFTNLDVKHDLEYSVYADFGGKRIDIMPYVFKMLTQGNGNISENITYFLQHSKEKNITILNFVYKESKKYNKMCYIFTNVTLDKIMESLLKGNYKVITIKDTKADGSKEIDYKSDANKDYKKTTPQGNSNTVLGWVLDVISVNFNLLSAIGGPMGWLNAMISQYVMEGIIDLICGDHKGCAMSPIPDPSGGLIKELWGLSHILADDWDSWRDDLTLPTITIPFPWS